MGAGDALGQAANNSGTDSAVTGRMCPCSVAAIRRPERCDRPSSQRVADAETTVDRSAQAVKWQQLNKDASDQVWIIPLLFGLSQHIAGTHVGNLFRWTPYASWPYAQLYVKDS